MTLSPRARWAASVLGWTLAAAALVQAFVLFVPYSLSWNISGSIPRGLYLTEDFSPDITLQRGDLVCFRYHAPSWAADRRYFPEGFRLCKPIAALPGDAVINDGKSIRVTVDGKSFQEAFFAATDRLGRPLHTQAMTSGPVAAGQLVLLAPKHANSFDSRYLGAVEVSKVTHRIWPLWVYE